MSVIQDKAPPRTVNVRAPTPAEAKFYASRLCPSCAGAGRVVVPRPEGRLVVMCLCAAQRMVKSHPGTMLLSGGRIVVDVDAEATFAAEAKRAREIAASPLVTP